MKKFLKILGTTTLAIFFMLTLTGCGKTTTTGHKDLVVWGFVDPDVFKPIIKDFEKKNSGVTVKYSQRGFNASYENDALNSMTSGEGPDVWAIPNDWVFRHRGKLAPVDNEVLKDKKIDIASTYSDPIIKDNIFDNKLYGLAPGIDVLQIYYNPELYSAAQEKALKATRDNDEQRQKLSKIFNNFPATWDELNQILPWLTTKNGATIQVSGIAIGTSNNVSKSADILSLLMLQNQTKMTSDDLTQSNINLPVKDSSGADVFAGTNSLNFYASYADPASPYYSWNSQMPNDVQAFVEGKAIMVLNYSSFSGYLNQIYPNFKFQRALIPQIGDLNPLIDYGSYTTYVVPSISPMTDVAWEFVLFLAGDEASTYNSATSQLQATKVTADTTLKARSSGGKPTKELVAIAKTWNKGRYPVEVDTIFNEAISRLNSKSQSAQASLDTAASRITELLRKSGW
ncbi:MAG: Uncharacterized protein Athens101428_677 [Candidatus Berkelbacteria bacterium Athens1014_28]|uniref:Multiple sugar transport system substrate-binding protein n=1 Tax=Candidatus Berkelbacteria bacterium Athens1014_28 TaxID=2017145 RepID=A0A554LKP6_9BACT|nr:MAG: Uncharacterized protein Athens101428_677 [Candidatus Berkelbacteria bacterium Athens1014_28]